MILKSVIHSPNTNSVEATWVDDEGVQVKCHSYADVQMDMLEADLGADAPAYADLIALVIAGIKPPVPPTPEQIQASIVTATQQRLDDFAKTRNYDGILSACTYAPSLIDRFRLDGVYCVGARDNTWAALYAFMGEVQAGTKPMPTSFADVEPLLPVLSWPV